MSSSDVAERMKVTRKAVFGGLSAAVWSSWEFAEESCSRWVLSQAQLGLEVPVALYREIQQETPALQYSAPPAGGVQDHSPSGIIRAEPGFRNVWNDSFHRVKCKYATSPIFKFCFCFYIFLFSSISFISLPHPIFQLCVFQCNISC